MDLSSEMIHALLPIFMTQVLGISLSAYGLIEGTAEAIALITKVFSGALSDYLGKRKVVAALGYSFSALTKPLFPLATSVSTIITARFLDRFGKGIRGAPRDAMVESFSTPEVRGASFGLRQALDTVGAFLGPLVATLLLMFMVQDLRVIFWIACIPALGSMALIWWGVSEPLNSIPRARKAFSLSVIKESDRSFKVTLLLAAILTASRLSEGFLILRASSLGVGIEYAPTILIVMNIVYSLSSYPAGAISDRYGRRAVILLGLISLTVSHLSMIIATSPLLFALGICLFGLHLGLTQGVVSALAADTAPKELMGSAFGVLNMIMGIAILISSSIAGLLWEHYGVVYTFAQGAALSVLALVGFLRFNPDLTKK